mmetsp:Transcript_28539/g.58437  ORF Transcript_28539/g.58437 Transcript_28539/m.58437 type:complete len:202 (+) Transcript_28539:364-969(+)
MSFGGGSKICFLRYISGRAVHFVRAGFSDILFCSGAGFSDILSCSGGGFSKILSSSVAARFSKIISCLVSCLVSIIGTHCITRRMETTKHLRIRTLLPQLIAQALALVQTPYFLSLFDGSKDEEGEKEYKTLDAITRAAPAQKCIPPAGASSSSIDDRIDDRMTEMETAKTFTLESAYFITLLTRSPPKAWLAMTPQTSQS